VKEESVVIMPSMQRVALGLAKARGRVNSRRRKGNMLKLCVLKKVDFPACFVAFE
jgi:hypothetical protein